MLAGKRCLITGATSGIGLQAVRVFMREGAQVCATGRNLSALEGLQNETKCKIFQGDLTDEKVPGLIVESAVKQLGGLTTVINCAGVLKGGIFGSEACDLDNFMFNFNSNTKAVFQVMHHSIPHLKQAGVESHPSIINVSSVNGLVSFGGVASYCASKAAVDMLSKCAAVDLAPFGIRVNCVNPGVVETELQKRGGQSQEQYEAFLKRSVEVTHPIASAYGRVAQPSEVGELMAFLASDKAAFITGDSIKIDGGRGCVGAR